MCQALGRGPRITRLLFMLIIRQKSEKLAANTASAAANLKKVEQDPWPRHTQPPSTLPNLARPEPDPTPPPPPPKLDAPAPYIIAQKSSPVLRAMIICQRQPPPPIDTNPSQTAALVNKTKNNNAPHAKMRVSLNTTRSSRASQPPSQGPSCLSIEDMRTLFENTTTSR